MVLAVVLLSGGLDSSTALAIASEKGYDVVALTFNYGQRHMRELESARRIAEHYNVKSHVEIFLGIGQHLQSSLTRSELELPSDGEHTDGTSGIPTTYVPGRNMVFLSVASAIAEGIGADAVVIAANAVDFSGYPDCTPEFIEGFQRLLEVGTKRGVEGPPVRVEAPLLRMSKEDIVREALRLEVPLELTWSCYSGGERACGTCDSCRLRLRGFAEAETHDPIAYEGRDEA
ncbi:MAG: 7-cyano-7-deazaguanine synthase QueC [Methanobacteriota archaeon]|nr:MAG: 7-cyano-7-deazaguanine synthase QueC [Euryarchaeota archaeon]